MYGGRCWRIVLALNIDILVIVAMGVLLITIKILSALFSSNIFQVILRRQRLKLNFWNIQLECIPRVYSLSNRKTEGLKLQSIAIKYFIKLYCLWVVYLSWQSWKNVATPGNRTLHIRNGVNFYPHNMSSISTPKTSNRRPISIRQQA